MKGAVGTSMMVGKGEPLIKMSVGIVIGHARTLLKIKTLLTRKEQQIFRFAVKWPEHTSHKMRACIEACYAKHARAGNLRGLIGQKIFDRK